jgi:hypothetical protein
VSTLAVCGALIGLVLGLRFKVLVLMPVVTVASVLLIAAGVWQGDTLTQTILSIVVFSCTLQAGYVCTAFFGHATSTTHAAERLPPLGTSRVR